MQLHEVHIETDDGESIAVEAHAVWANSPGEAEWLVSQDLMAGLEPGEDTSNISVFTHKSHPIPENKKHAFIIGDWTKKSVDANS